jgi:hypothetical protein
MPSARAATWAAKWYVEFRDQLECVRRLPGFTSKAATEELGRNLDKLVSFHKTSGGQLDPKLTEFVAGLENRVRERLIAIGLLAPDRVAKAKPLADHLADFAAAIRAKGSTERHVALVTGRVRRVFDGCGFRSYGDIHADKVSAFLSNLRAGTQKKAGISAQTFNFHLQACKQFCRWAIKSGRTVNNPLAHLEGLNVKTDRRRDRRAFTVEELRRLLDVARTGPERYGVSGQERHLLIGYRWRRACGPTNCGASPARRLT